MSLPFRQVRLKVETNVSQLRKSTRFQSEEPTQAEQTDGQTDPETRPANGRIIPGARVVETYDLIERGLAFSDDIQSRPGYAELMREVRARFERL